MAKKPRFLGQNKRGEIFWLGSYWGPEIGIVWGGILGGILGVSVCLMGWCK